MVYAAWDTQPLHGVVWQEADEELKVEILRRNMDATRAHCQGCSARVTTFHCSLSLGMDARIVRLYGLSGEQLRYILAPQAVYEADFSGETFRVLKEKEMQCYGKYRKWRMVLEV